MNTARRDETYYARCLDCQFHVESKNILERGNDARQHSQVDDHSVQMWDKVVYPVIKFRK